MLRSNCSFRLLASSVGVARVEIIAGAVGAAGGGENLARGALVALPLEDFPVLEQSLLIYRRAHHLTPIAEQLIVEGFFQSTLRKLECPAVEAAVWDVINQPR